MGTPYVPTRTKRAPDHRPRSPPTIPPPNRHVVHVHTDRKRRGRNPVTKFIRAVSARRSAQPGHRWSAGSCLPFVPARPTSGRRNLCAAGANRRRRKPFALPRGPQQEVGVEQLDHWPPVENWSSISSSPIRSKSSGIWISPEREPSQRRVGTLSVPTRPTHAVCTHATQARRSYPRVPDTPAAAQFKTGHSPTRRSSTSRATPPQSREYNPASTNR